jgi:hypothetical protein
VEWGFDLYTPPIHLHRVFSCLSLDKTGLRPECIIVCGEEYSSPTTVEAPNWVGLSVSL